MLLQNSLSLENEVVRILTVFPRGLSAEELRSEVAKTMRAYSRRGIYKELQRLIAEGILVRGKGVYSLRLAWLLSLQSEITKITQQINHIEYLNRALPSKEEPVILRSSDLVHWDRQWTQLMLIMHTMFPKLPMFIWSPHNWFTLTHPEIEKTFTAANESKRNLRYLIIGGRSFLDLRDRPILKRKSTGYSFRVSPFEYDRTHYYWIIGDYVGTNTLDTTTAAQIDEIYATTKNESDLGKHIKKLLSRRCRGVVKCEWAPERAQKLRKKFIAFFKIELSEAGELLHPLKGELL